MEAVGIFLTPQFRIFVQKVISFRPEAEGAPQHYGRYIIALLLVASETDALGRSDGPRVNSRKIVYL
ncbi:hypothetical protein IMCC21224_113489 [Puniceibacterium sp. IMCC21224]|nr:hypothetical protein IMCC21224_113489 [Puniceibacterium sp. IMCC21224]